MALENKKLSAYDDLASANIDTTTKLVVLTGATKVNNNLPVTNFIEDSLTSTSVVKPLSAKQGKTLQDTKAPIANPTFTGAVNGITKSMVGLGNVDNTSDVQKVASGPIANALDLRSEKANPVFTGSLSMVGTVVDGDENSDIIFEVKKNIGENAFSINDYGYSIFWKLVQFLSAPNIDGLETFADNTAAAALSTGTVYKTPTGVLMIKY